MRRNLIDYRQPVSLRSLAAAAGVVSSLLALMLASSPALAAILVVSSGGCTLADAIRAANTDSPAGLCPAGAGSDHIVLTHDVLLTTVDNSDLDGDNGLPVVTSQITVLGQGFKVERASTAPRFRIFKVGPGGTLDLRKVTVRGGQATDPGHGGGIWNAGFLALENSTITENDAGIGWPYYYGRGGGIYNTGTLDIDRSTISYNLAGQYLQVGGGGIWTSGPTTITGSTVSGNHAPSEYVLGGGIGNTGTAPVSITNSTIAFNSAAYGAAATGSTILRHTTIADNQTFPDVGPGADLQFGTFTLYDSILARSRQVDNVDLCGTAGTTIIDGGGNFDDDGSCGSGFGILTGLDTNLANNGGPTSTFALLSGSAAIDSATSCAVAIDQRGYARLDSICDAGSFEHGALPVIVVIEAIAADLLQLTVENAVPEGMARPFLGPEPGFFQLPGGSCPGTVLDLSEPETGPLFEIDSEGRGSTTIELDASQSGYSVQLLDGSTCLTSDVARIDGCLALSTGSSGPGEDPSTSPESSAGCEPGGYLPGELVQLVASPEPGAFVAGWSGTDDDASLEIENSVTMPDTHHHVHVTYGADGVVCSDVGSFVARCRVGPAGNSLQARAILTDASHNGETLAVAIDGRIHVLEIVGRRAQISLPGAAPGLHVVELVDPPLCLPPIEVDCP